MVAKAIQKAILTQEEVWNSRSCPFLEQNLDSEMHTSPRRRYNLEENTSLPFLGMGQSTCRI
ncbi:hypothetical protein V6Z12_D05G093100 [Gossypium hirsutum]